MHSMDNGTKNINGQLLTIPLSFPFMPWKITETGVMLAKSVEVAVAQKCGIIQ